MRDGPSVQRRPKNIVLILAREFASKLATPAFVNDAEGTLVYYNEPAEVVLGRSFAEAGEMLAEQWTALFSVERPDGTPMPLEEIPGARLLLVEGLGHELPRWAWDEVLPALVDATG